VPGSLERLQEDAPWDSAPERQLVSNPPDLPTRKI
jgi:hypothetical protein